MRIPEFEIYHLVVFYHVAREESITAAASKLFITQPAVTSHIKSLERITGLKLIEVRKQRTILTPAGKGLYQYAREIYEQSVLAGRFVELMRDSSFNIGIVPIFNCVVAPVLKTICEEQDCQTKITVESKESYYLIKDVQDSTIDLAVTAAVRDEESPKLSFIRVADKLKLVFYASPKHPVFNKERITWEDIFDYQLIIGTEMSIIKRFLQDKLRLKVSGLELQRKLSIIANIDLKKKLIKTGDFLGVTLLQDIEEEIKIGALRTVSFPDDITIGVDVVIYPDAIKSPMVRRFIALIKNAFK